MARQGINIGSSANDGTGDPLRTAFDKINDNFVELYGTDNDINTLDANLNVNTFAITTGVTNGDITVTPNGTGSINLGAVKFKGTSISSDDSTIININEGLVVSGTASVSGALSSSTSLALATGATVTGIDNGALGSSATLLATQGAIKTYVDAQVTAQDLDFTADDSTTLSIDLDSESLQFSGGTGITTAGTGNTVTFAIDGTVATLAGSQTLTNKVLTNPTINAATMTGAVAIDGVTIDDNSIKANASNADLELDGSGTGHTKILANATVVGTLNTADIATTGTHTITGQLDAESVRIKDNTITTNASNANLELSANGSGVVDVKNAMTTIGQTVTGTVSVTGNVAITGQFDVDNISISGNGIIATNSGGGININPNATGQVTIGGTVVQVPGMFSTTNLNLTNNLFLGASALITTNVSNADINIEANGTGSVYVDQLRFRNNNITTHITNADLELNTDGTGTIELQTATNVTGNLSVSGAFIGSRQTISGAGAINLTTLYTEITTTSGDAYTLANGVIGQMKIIVMVVDGGDATITPTTFANGTRIVMDAVHDSVTLIYGASGWQVIASRNIVIS